MLIKSFRISAVHEDDGQDSRTELDSHADTCVVGQNALITYNFETLVQVTGYDNVNAKYYKTVSAAVVYDDPMSGQMKFENPSSTPSLLDHCTD